MIIEPHWLIFALWNFVSYFMTSLWSAWVTIPWALKRLCILSYYPLSWLWNCRFLLLVYFQMIGFEAVLLGTSRFRILEFFFWTDLLLLQNVLLCLLMLLALKSICPLIQLAYFEILWIMFVGLSFPLFYF